MAFAPIGRLGIDGRKMRHLTMNSVNRAMAEIAPVIQADIQRRISKPYPPESKPGQAPHLRTGALHDSITVTSSRGSLKVRAAEHGVFLENGTVNMAPRPFVTRVLYDGRTKYADKIVTRARELMRR